MAYLDKFFTVTLMCFEICEIILTLMFYYYYYLIGVIIRYLEIISSRR